MYTSFIEALPDKVRSTDDFEQHGTRFRKKEKALKHRYVEANQLYKKYIILDLDKPGAAFLWEEKRLPPPTIITINPENAHCHYLYELNTPVYYTEEARRAPQQFYENTDAALTAALDADTSYVGKFTKTPQHRDWRTIIHHRARYDLEDFGEYYLDLQKQKKKQKLEGSLGGRNDTLFDHLRQWAYIEVKKHGFYAPFHCVCESKAMSINSMFVDSQYGVLPAKEVISTATSVSKWTWRHRHTIGDQKNRGVMDLPEDLPMRFKQKLGADYTHTTRKQTTKEAILQSAIALKEAGTPVTQQSVAVRADVSLLTVKRYWTQVDSKLGLYKRLS